VTYIVIVLVAIVLVGFVFNYWVHHRTALERVFVSSLPAESATALLGKKLKGYNPFARISRSGHTMSREYVKSVPRSSLKSQATLYVQVEVNPLARAMTGTGEKRTTLVTIGATNILTPRVMFMPVPQAAWAALRREWKLVRHLRRQDPMLMELAPAQITALSNGDVHFLAAGTPTPELEVTTTG
jgi:hypothetical protein